MTAPSGGGYFVRVRGRVHGPYELSRLKVLRARGQFSSVFEVSEDGRRWVSSETVTELLAPPPPEEPSVQNSDSFTPQPASHLNDPFWDDWAPRRRRNGDGTLGTVLLVLALVIVPAGIVGGIMLMQRLERRPEPAPADPDSPADNETPAEVTPAVDPRGVATAKYWSDFLAARNRLNEAGATDGSALASRWVSIADEMRSLPTLDVDEEAVQLVLDYATALTHLAAAVRATNDPSTYVEAFLRGADGDPFGKALEMKASQDAAFRELQTVEQRLARVRANLTARHHQQFP
jgi:hypothetical protein